MSKPKQLLGESYIEYLSRKQFYEFIQTKNIDINDCEKLSKIWTNITYRECRYSSKLFNYIMKLNKEFLKN